MGELRVKGLNLENLEDLGTIGVLVLAMLAPVFRLLSYLGSTERLRVTVLVSVMLMVLPELLVFPMM